MKRYILPALFAGAMLAASCGGNTEGGASTPTDSTNNTGAAPVNYEAGTPEQTVPQTTVQSDAVTSDTNGTAGAAMNGQAGQNANSSNTTDKRTTSGSAPGNVQNR